MNNYLWILLIVQTLLTFTYSLDKKYYKLPYTFTVAFLLLLVMVAPSHSLLTKTWCAVVIMGNYTNIVAH